MRRISTYSLCLTLLATAGCGDPFSNDLLKADVQFLHAAPSPELIRVEVPQQATVLRDGQYLTQAMAGYEALTCEEIAARNDTLPDDYCDQRAAAGEEALFHCFTVHFTGGVNCGVLSFLELVDMILTFPPSAREENKRIWGPWPGEIGSRLDHRFEMVREVETGDETEDTAPVVFRYALQVRSKDRRDLPAHEGWVDAMSGQSEPYAGTRYGTGDLVFDVDAIKGEDPEELGQGQLMVTYDTRSAEGEAGPCEETSIDIAFSDFVGGGDVAKAREEGDPDPLPLDATYNFVRRADCAGEFYFEQWGDTDAGSNPLRHAKERLEYMIRWNDSGAGRADVRASEGDLVDLEIFSRECWDADFASTYLHMDWDPQKDAGDAGRCVLEAWDFGE